MSYPLPPTSVRLAGAVAPPRSPWPALRRWCLPGLAALLLAAAAAPARNVWGTYRLAGSARVAASPLPEREVDLHADAVLSPGAREGELRVRLAAEGASCALTALLAPGGALAFAPGQTCSVELRSPEAEGRVQARLTAGSGRARDGLLFLDLAFSLSGALRIRAAEDALGALLGAPGGGEAAVPVRGEARGSAQGHRDESRATGG